MNNERRSGDRRGYQPSRRPDSWRTPGAGSRGSGGSGSERGERPAQVRGRQDDRRQDDRPRRDPGPEIPDEITASMLDREVQRALRGLGEGNAEATARHLVMAGQLLDEEPEAAYTHAKAAFSRAARVDVVREAVGIAAYRTGRFAEALRELRALRRMSGRQDLRHLEADCLRGLQRPDDALDVIKDTDTSTLDLETRLELILIASGAHADRGASEAGLALLDRIRTKALNAEQLDRFHGVRADRLEELGRTEEAKAVRPQQPAATAASEDEIVFLESEDEDDIR
ncbi:hypothetical protein EDD31_2629 [Bogoriella caseilytica]|uniref:Tetratricopeptide repeat protein n=1 Tax=Bogoriella caseilytica TaxID=56055 RepID=A0A3N2BG77_9MICO|nr:hypothetical protein EDD31_2629 [Bogoriella caseilytica]